jgi:outer membrane protein assembly complex protein YaeT
MRTPTVILTLALVALAGCGGDGKGVPIVWEGNDRFGKGELAAIARRELESFQERRRRSDLADAAYAMEARLHDRGNPHGRVTFELVGDEAAPSKVIFRVAEGPRAIIDGIDFPGQHHFGDERLRLFFTAGSGVLGIGDPLYRPSAIDDAVQAVERLYLLNGYYRVRVGPVVTRWNARRDEADLTVPIVEGPLYRVSDVEITIDGHPELDPAQLREAAAVRGGVFHVRLGQEAAARVRSWLLARGYVDARVTADAEIDDAAAAALIRLQVTPGPLTTLRRVVVENPGGNTRPGFVRHHIPLRPGEVARREPLDEGLRYLYRSGLFTQVQSEWRRDSPDSSEADLIVKLEEARSRRIDFLAGYGSYEQLRGGITVGDTNLFGFGVRGELGVSASLKSRGVEGSLGYDIGPRDGVDLTVGQEFRERPSFDRITTSSELAYRHDFDRSPWFFNGPARVTIGHRFEVARNKNIEGAIDEAEILGTYRNSAPFTRLRRDTRDSVLDPRNGSVFDLGLAWNTPLLGADLDFLEYSSGFAKFVALDERITLGVGARYVTLQILDGRDTLPVGERLRLGGDTTVRSFREDELGPSNDQNKPLGGLTSAVANVELRYRLIGPFEVAGFYDVGAIGSETWRVDRPPGQGVGGGLRYILPVGPIRFDAAYNPGERFAANRAWTYHISVGLAF